MIDFKHRSNQAEMMDGLTDPNILSQNYLEIAAVNKYLGGYNSLGYGLNKLLKSQKNNRKQFTLLDIGCGAGDNIEYIYHWAKKNKFSINLIGLDYSKTAITMAEEKFSKLENIHFICLDYKMYKPEIPIDIIISTLFNHHLSNEENLSYLKWCISNAQLGFILNDLHRHPIAYYSIKWIANLAKTSAYFRNDAPLSVLRAFKKKELKAFLKNVSIEAKVYWCWAFRWIVIYEK